MNVLNHVADETAKEKLTKFSQKFLDMLDCEDQASFASSAVIGKAVSEAFSEAFHFHRLVCNLLMVETQGKLSEQDVLYFERYKGPCTFRKAVRSFMNTPEPEGPNKTEIKAKSRELLRQAKVDVLKTCATSGAATTTMQTFISQLKEAQAQDLQPGCSEVLGRVLAEYTNLTTKVRAGAIGPLKSAVVSFAKIMTNKVGG